tara:strand:+ start:332 stop:460 length:129 start_codon:yes stop_codon:yes gene_type:complete
MEPVTLEMVAAEVLAVAEPTVVKVVQEQVETTEALEVIQDLI